MKIRRRTVIIMLSIIALAIIVTLGINGYKTKKIADKEDQIIEIKLFQSEGDLSLEVQDIPDDKRPGDIEDLNALFTPTKETFNILNRWEVVHQIDPEYPYPETLIKEEDWMGMNQYLYGDADDEAGGAKAEMVYDENNNIDNDVYEYIMANVSSDHPVVEEAEEQIAK